ncbi:PaaI family thioesterase [uncultured Tateyamaria sp.]|uniref:PaaI family thioesterase n=1 Tax=uncultured Tateyamaria sp. TaxID=455651 RepID=UPI002635FB90|nr:PaaI family thioesterase [uncultured Tateyamaria sp.]
MITNADAQAFLDQNFAAWVLALSPRVTACSTSGLTLDIPITDDIARVGGIVSGQALATLADTAMVLAAGAHLGRMMPVATVTLDTQFLRPGSGESVRAEAEIIRAGRSMIFARCTLSALPAAKPIAHATATFALPG